MNHQLLKHSVGARMKTGPAHEGTQAWYRDSIPQMLANPFYVGETRPAGGHVHPCGEHVKQRSGRDLTPNPSGKVEFGWSWSWLGRGGGIPRCSALPSTGLEAARRS